MEVMYPRCAGLDVHKETVVACVRIASGGEASPSVRTFTTTTAGLIELGEWLEENGCTHVAMEATGVYWKPVWQVLADSSFELILANAAHVKRHDRPRGRRAAEKRDEGAPSHVEHNPPSRNRRRLQAGKYRHRKVTRKNRAE
jgi:transposase